MPSLGSFEIGSAKKFRASGYTASWYESKTPAPDGSPVVLKIRERPGGSELSGSFALLKSLGEAGVEAWAPVYEVGLQDGREYCAMLLCGTSISEALKGGFNPSSAAVSAIVGAVVRALIGMRDHLASKGGRSRGHGSIKPENILVDQQDKKPLEESPIYLADPVDDAPRADADIAALGRLIYQLISGKETVSLHMIQVPEDADFSKLGGRNGERWHSLATDLLSPKGPYKDGGVSALEEILERVEEASGGGARVKAGVAGFGKFVKPVLIGASVIAVGYFSVTFLQARGETNKLNRYRELTAWFDAEFAETLRDLVPESNTLFDGLLFFTEEELSLKSTETLENVSEFLGREEELESVVSTAYENQMKEWKTEWPQSSAPQFDRLAAAVDFPEKVEWGRDTGASFKLFLAEADSRLSLLRSAAKAWRDVAPLPTDAYSSAESNLRRAAEAHFSRVWDSLMQNRAESLPAGAAADVVHQSLIEGYKEISTLAVETDLSAPRNWARLSKDQKTRFLDSLSTAEPSAAAWTSWIEFVEAETPDSLKGLLESFDAWEEEARSLQTDWESSGFEPRPDVETLIARLDTEAANLREDSSDGPGAEERAQEVLAAVDEDLAPYREAWAAYQLLQSDLSNGRVAQALDRELSEELASHAKVAEVLGRLKDVETRVEALSERLSRVRLGIERFFELIDSSSDEAKFLASAELTRARSEANDAKAPRLDGQVSLTQLDALEASIEAWEGVLRVVLADIEFYNGLGQFVGASNRTGALKYIEDNKLRSKESLAPLIAVADQLPDFSQRQLEALKTELPKLRDDITRLTSDINSAGFDPRFNPVSEFVSSREALNLMIARMDDESGSKALVDAAEELKTQASERLQEERAAFADYGKVFQEFKDGDKSGAERELRGTPFSDHAGFVELKARIAAMPDPEEPIEEPTGIGPDNLDSAVVNALRTRVNALSSKINSLTSSIRVAAHNPAFEPRELNSVAITDAIATLRRSSLTKEQFDDINSKVGGWDSRIGAETQAFNTYRSAYALRVSDKTRARTIIQGAGLRSHPGFAALWALLQEVTSSPDPVDEELEKDYLRFRALKQAYDRWDGGGRKGRISKKKSDEYIEILERIRAGDLKDQKSDVTDATLLELIEGYRDWGKI